MTTDTQLANRSLALIGEGRITSIDDPDDQAARLCKSLIGDAIAETIRPHRWACATLRTALPELSPAPAFGWAHNYQLPADYIRLLEVNGEPVIGSQSSFVIEGRKILMDSTSCVIRYLRAVPIAEMDVSLRAAVAAKLASLIAIPLTKNVQLKSAADQEFTMKVGEAAKINAIESQENENVLIRAVRESWLVRSRFGRTNLYPHRR